MIDTLKASKKLLENGFSPQQSEVLVHVIAQRDEERATKHDIRSLQKDIQSLREETKKDNQSLKEETKASIQSLKEAMEKSHSIMFWILGLSIPAVIATTVTVLIFFAQHVHN